MTNFALERQGPKVKVIVGSALSAAIAPDLRELLCAIQEDGVKELTLDLCQTTTIDADGLQLLLVAHNSFLGGEKALRLIRVPDSIFALLETLRLNQILAAQTE